MRADAHYVDQLETPTQPVIRLVATGQIECRDLPPSDRLEALTASITAHGVLQPLIIRRQSGRYSLIAGRKRLAAAIAAGLSSVPCVLHDVDAATAAAIAAADNLKVDDPSSPVAAERHAFQSLLQELTSDLSSIRTSLTLLRTPRLAGLSQRVGADLIEAQAFRAAWLIGSMAGKTDNDRPAPLAAIVHGIGKTFEAHRSLMGLDLECSVSAGAAVWRLPEAAATAAITGAVFATLACLDGVDNPRIEVRADVPRTRALKIEVVQRAVRIPANLGAGHDPGRPAELLPALALRLARALAADHGGNAELTPLPDVGSVLQITFAHTNAPA
jgi:ParB/RepB/Spo0J family partition protein